MTVAAYRDRATGRYPITLDDLRRSAGMLFGEEPNRAVLDFVGVDPVEAVERPALNPATQTISEGQPSLSGSTWLQTWVVTDLPLAPVLPVVLYPADLWRRTTEEEAEAIEGAMAQQSARLRNLFRSAQTYQSDDPLWPVLLAAATGLFGEARTAELLAPSA